MENLKTLKLELDTYRSMRDKICEERSRIEKMLADLDNENTELNNSILKMEKCLKDLEDEQVKIPEFGVKIDYETFSKIVNAVSFAVTYGGCDKELLNRTIALGKASERVNNDPKQINIEKAFKKHLKKNLEGVPTQSVPMEITPMGNPHIIEIGSMDDLIKMLANGFNSNENKK